MAAIQGDLIINEWPAQISGDPALGGTGPFDPREVGGPCHVIGATMHRFEGGEATPCWLVVGDNERIIEIAMSRVRVVSWAPDED